MRNLPLNSSVFLFTLFVSQVLLGQCEDITLNNQTEIDNFFTNYGCTEIEGSLHVSGEDIYNLEGLSAITSINESFIIQSCPNLETIIGWDNLNTIGETLLINDNSQLTHISGFSHLNIIGDQSVIGGLVISNNENLLNVIDFDQLTKIYGNVEINANPSLENINGFSKVETVQIGFKILDNSSLINIDGFQELTSVSGPFTIDLSPSLQDLNFNSLSHIYGDFNVKNTALIDMSGFANLALIGGFVIIDNTWTNLTGLNSISKINTLHFLNTNHENFENLFPNLTEVNHLTFEKNPQLEKIEAFDNLQIVNEYIRIVENPQLEKIEAFDNLKLIKYLTIVLNGLKEIKGFNSVEKVEWLVISDNSKLESIEGFSQLETIHELKLSQNPLLYNLEGFRHLKKIEAMLQLESLGALQDLKAFSNASFGDLTTKMNLTITNNTQLKNIDGLSNITELITCRIISNPLLENLDALSNLKNVFRYFDIIDNSSLTKLNFPKIQRLYYLTISNNTQLKEISGFDKVYLILTPSASFADYIPYFIAIDTNPNLKSINGFSNLAILPTLIIHDNQQLEEINAFQNLRELNSLGINSNPNITNLDFFEKLYSLGYASITQNTQLSDCCSLLCTEDFSSISSLQNDSGCNSIEEIQQSCQEVHWCQADSMFVALEGIYPNPVTDYLNFTLTSLSDTDVYYEISNSLGKTIESRTLYTFAKSRETFRHDFFNYPKGLYFLKVIHRETGEELSVRFIKN